MFSIREIEKEQINTHQESNKAKSMFLANMSHEMRIPIMSIMGTIETLEIEKPENQKKIKIAQESCEQLYSLINSTLDISKIEAGQLNLEKSYFPLNKTLEEVCMTIESGNRNSNILFEFKNHLSEEVTIFSDQSRLKQILHNLLSNAFKFTEKGKITLEATQFQNKFFLRVSDTGVGIPKENLENVFEGFYQVDESSTRKFGGAGLGLAISKEITALLGGKIKVESKLKQGTTFLLEFPFESRLNPENILEGNQEPASKIHNKEFLRILLVEDNEDIHLIVKAYLSKTGHQIDFAINGEVGVEMFINGEYDLILMDVQMPVMDGFEATTKIREHEKENQLERVTIISFSANSVKEDIDRIIDCGCDLNLMKPIKRAQLLAQLDVLMGKSEDDQAA